MTETGRRTDPTTTYQEPDWLLRGAFPPERVQILLSAAQELGIPGRIVLKADRQGTREMVPAGMEIVEINYGKRVNDFYQEVERLSLMEEPAPELVTPGV